MTTVRLEWRRGGTIPKGQQYIHGSNYETPSKCLSIHGPPDEDFVMPTKEWWAPVTFEHVIPLEPVPVKGTEILRYTNTRRDWFEFQSTQQGGMTHAYAASSDERLAILAHNAAAAVLNGDREALRKIVEGMKGARTQRGIVQRGAGG